MVPGFFSHEEKAPSLPDATAFTDVESLAVRNSTTAPSIASFVAESMIRPTTLPVCADKIEDDNTKINDSTSFLISIFTYLCVFFKKRGANQL